MKYGRHSLVLCGGGLDSYVAAWDNQNTHWQDRTVLLYIDYGAKAAEREKAATVGLATAMNNFFGSEQASTVILPGFDLWSKWLNSPLTDDGIPVNKRPQPGVASEWVAARNTVMMSVAIAMAEHEDFARIVTGINRTAAAAYPDNDMQWLKRFQYLIEYATNDRRIDLRAPVGEMRKFEIVNAAFAVGMPADVLDQSWSCYEGGKKHCGKCSSCMARRQAFADSAYFDSTEYEL